MKLALTKDGLKFLAITLHVVDYGIFNNSLLMAKVAEEVFEKIKYKAGKGKDKNKITLSGSQVVALNTILKGVFVDELFGSELAIYTQISTSIEKEYLNIKHAHDTNKAP